MLCCCRMCSLKEMPADSIRSRSMLAWHAGREAVTDSKDRQGMRHGSRCHLSSSTASSNCLWPAYGVHGSAHAAHLQTKHFSCMSCSIASFSDLCQVPHQIPTQLTGLCCQANQLMSVWVEVGMSVWVGVGIKAVVGY